MSESCKEQRPLLCDDFLDEEAFEYRPCQKRHMGYRGRARNNIRGAAAIIKNWPDHLTVSVSYWWIGLGMFAFMIFVIYNTLLYASLPSAYSKLVNEQPTHGLSTHLKVLPEVFMHIIVNTEKEANLNKYLPYINIVADKYVHYKFNLIMLFNDTTNETDKLNHQLKLNNEEALNSLWSVNNINDFLTTPRQKLNNIIIKQVNLSSYLNASPVRKYWKSLPHQLIEFLLRAVSIWEKGGIAFNPILLTPRSPHSIYIEKLYNLLQTYQTEPKIKVAEKANQTFSNQIFKQKKKVNEFKQQPRKQVNNIRDIIDNLNNEHNSQGETESLSEAENRQIQTKVDMKPYLNNLIIITKEEDTLNLTGTQKLNVMLSNKTEVNAVRLDAGQRLEESNDTKRNEFLPSFVRLFFPDKSNIAMYEATTRHTIKRSSRTSPTNFLSNEMEQNNIIQPMIIPAPTVFDTVIRTDIQDIARVAESENYLTIDLKGNLLSTRTPCHAFIGSVLNNVKYCGENESLKDFIISELSKFCKGLLSSCKGIDVILL